ncbi:hypothetical protein F5Y14DRAFT_105174 [Nemania sp. NC0429]|nr:hypothetical protein F5Y14DRAFT_105174 [Nemania sp. NC0429]
MIFHPVLDRQAVRDRLHHPTVDPPVPQEEENHPWQPPYSFPRFQEPLLRVWDDVTGSPPEDDNRMMSRAPERRLDDRESRQKSLCKHFNYCNWTPSPYISFTTSAARVEDLAEKRVSKGRGPQMLTVIDPNIRLRKGLPILNAKDEMDYYGIRDPYGMGYKYYYDEYLCLWQVTEAEVIGHWEWADLNAYGADWYRNIILPAFRDFTATADSTLGLFAEPEVCPPTEQSTDDLASMLAKLSGMF